MPTEPPRADSTLLGQRTFQLEDQLRFASLSGDANPMHVDPVAARRLMTGRPVVHGVHTLLVALEGLPASDLADLQALACEFANPVSVGDLAEVRLVRTPGESAELQATVGALVCTRITLQPTAIQQPGTAAAAASGVEPIAAMAQPLDRPPPVWAGTRQALPLPLADFSAAFPRLCDRWGERQVAAIALLSTYVGMVCPGLHSVFAALHIEVGNDPAGPVTFTVDKYDPRFKMYVVRFDGPVRGQLRAFQRPPMQDQPTMDSLLPRVQARSWSGRRAWVIGGSRGLGEVAAKLAAAGGADVAVTYAAGRADAERVVADINQAGHGDAEAWPLDVMRDDWDVWLADRPPPDAVLYFASPRIFRKKADVLDAAQLQEFMDCYVHRFAALCVALDARATRPVTVFLPSTVFIDERPRGMTEYAMAKAAAEVLAADLGRSLTWVRFAVERLPKLTTDQTATVMGTKTASNVDVLLPIVTAVMAGGAPPG